MSWRDHFQDMQAYLDGQEAGAFGMLGGAGADHVFTVVDNGLSAEGPVIWCTCQRCGNRVQWTPSWVETAIVSQKQAPRDDQTGQTWNYDPETMALRAPGHCGSCRAPLTTLTMTPEEAGKYLNKGVAANVVNPQFIQGVVQRLRMQNQGR